MTQPLMFLLLCDKIKYFEQSKSQDCNVSKNQKKERKNNEGKRYCNLLILLAYYAAANRSKP